MEHGPNFIVKLTSMSKVEGGGIEVLAAVTLKRTVVWDVTPCNLIEVFGRLR
jgi:hypothetical protein